MNNTLTVFHYRSTHLLFGRDSILLSFSGLTMCTPSAL